MRKGSRPALAALAMSLAFAGLCAPPAIADDDAIPMPRATIYPGDTIRDEMLVDRAPRRDTGSLEGVHRAREGLVGKVARGTLMPEQPIALGAVRAPNVITQGQPAMVVFETGALVIAASAVPLQSGAVGETISLRNAESGTTIRGVVQEDGTIRVGFQ